MARLAAILVALTLAGCRERLPPPDAPRLDGTSWRLVEFRGGDDSVLAPAPGAAYAITFGYGGRAAVRADCRTGTISWAAEGFSQLRLGPLAAARADCPEPLTERFERDLPAVR